MRKAAVVLAAAMAACGPGDLRVTLAPIPTLDACGKPTDARSLVVSAYGDFATAVRSIDLGAPVTISDFPADTRQLGVEVLGPGGVFSAVGATQPLDLADLADGAQVPILMAPRDGFCEVTRMAAGRDHPLVARAGQGVLVLGGDGDGGPLTDGEYYDPTTGTFTAVDVSSAVATMGLDGATATTLPGGSVVVAGGRSPGFAIFDPTKTPLALGTTALLTGGVRAHHAAVALDDTHVLLAGGCASVAADTGACMPGSARTDTSILDITTGKSVAGPTLVAVRLDGNATLEPTGADLTGPTGVLLSGGVDLAAAPVTTIERFDPAATGTAMSVAGAGGLAAPLGAGGVMLALASPGAPAAGGAAVIAPGAAPHAVGGATARAGAVLVALQDGTIAAIGGVANASVDRYVPSQEAWVPTPAADGSEGPAGIAGLGAALLDDGTVLVVGGHDAASTAQDGAWIYRPVISGMFVDGVTVAPASTNPVDALGQLDPLAPALVDTSSGFWELGTGGAGLTSWAIATGPEIIDGSVVANVSPTGDVAVLVGFVDPAHFDAVVLPAAQGTARLERHAPGGITTLCTGSAVPAGVGVGGAIAIDVERHGDHVTATVTPQGAPAVGVIECAPGIGARGKAGVGPAGDGASLIVGTITVSH